MQTSSIRRLVKRAATRAGLDHGIAAEISGHSMRVGAAQDMMVTGFDMLAIMQAGGWKTPTVVARYVENASTRSLHERRWAALGGSPLSILPSPSLARLVEDSERRDSEVVPPCSRGELARRLRC